MNKGTCIITTYHKSLSYGGCLQAYATYVLMKERGYDTAFLDYENEYEARNKESGNLLKGTPKEIAINMVKRYLFKGSEYQRRAFGLFHASLPKTEKSYSNVDDIQDVDASVIIVASDQVWNPEITNGFDPVFFLKFGNADAKRISFSSSMGSHVLSGGEREAFAKLLEGFDAISVRESFAKKQIEEASGLIATVCMDPTLQLNSTQWRQVANNEKPSCDGPYALLFTVASTESRYLPLIARIKNELGLKVVQIRLNSKRAKDVDLIVPATPFELVNLIDSAALVLTDSFHGTAFSINMNTPFYVLPNRKNNVRLEEILRRTGLSERLLLDDALPQNIDLDINFDATNMALERCRAVDAEWLSTALA